MSKQIDWTQPLSSEDHRWASQFAKHNPLIEANVAEHGHPDERDSAGTLDGEQPAKAYADMTVSELRDEIAARNKEFGTTMPVVGKKPELIAQLEADDAEAAEKAAAEE